MSKLLEQMQEDLYNGQAAAVEAATRTGLDQGLSAKEILDDGLIGGMDVVGRDFRAGELFIPEVLIAAKAMHAGLEILRPLLAESGAPSMGKMVIGTVQGDLHDIGKNLVSMMMQGAGFEMIDLGTDVTPDQFVDAVQANGPDLIGMSALLTTTMPAMKATVEALTEAGLREQVKVIVGGAPVTADFATQIGADGYAPDAAAAVDAARDLIA
jgi:5-methyltetrahydrofolate--homocysteine methyltransferase